MLGLSVISLLALAALAPWVQRGLGRWAGGAMALVPAGWSLWFASQYARVTGGEALRESGPWVPGMGVNWSFSLDGLALLFALLVCGVGALVVLYAGSYLKGHAHLGRFHLFLLAFMASMLGLVLADNVITLFIFWELTSVTSYLLIGFDHDRPSARAAALQALLVTGLGGLAMLAGLVMLGLAAGSMELSVILGAEGLREHPLYAWMTGLILLGAFTKSAVFPFHFWLPSAMEAPSPVSAYLHSSTMVKAGVYLLARTQPALGETALWTVALVGLGALTMLLGAHLGSRETVYKRLLAYTTVSSLGAMVMLIGMGPSGAQAATVYLLSHALFKGALFLVAGLVDHGAGEKDIEKLGGLRRAMPITAGAAMLAGLSMAGLPPLFGFAGKELLLKASLGSPELKWLVVGAATLAGSYMVMIALMVGFKPFLGARVETPREAHEGPAALWLGPALLAALGALAGLAPGVFASGLTGAAAESIAPGSEAAGLSLVDLAKPSMALALSAVALVVGAGMFAARTRWRAATGFQRALDRAGPERGYEASVSGLTLVAAWQTRVLQSGNLNNYLRIIIVTLIGLVGFALLWNQDFVMIRPALVDVSFFEAALALLAVAASVMAASARSRLAAVAALGVVGYSVAVLFVRFGAPDVAMTQFAIETLTVIIFVLVVYHLPRFAIMSSRRLRNFDAAVATVFGATMSLMALVAAGSTPERPISWYFSERSVTEGHGRNVVNVILVDFRSLDTLGEIVVLGTAAIGVYTLLRLRSGKEGAR